MAECTRCLLCLGNGVTFYVNLKPMGRFQRFLRLWVYRPLDVMVLDSMNCINKIEVAFAMLLLSVKQVSLQWTAIQGTAALTPEFSD